MSTVPVLIDRYIAIWNETDTATRRRLIAQTWADDARYVDPLMQGEGHAGIDGMIAAVQQQFPGFVFRLSRAAETVGDRLRFSWEAGPQGGDALVGGTDFATLAGGRLQAVTGFIDFAPQ
jgi:hypothetical protein